MAVKERPILFSAPMVRAILEGRKTQTRRIVKPQPEPDGRGGHDWPSNLCKSMVSVRDMVSLGPYGYRGDRLWVREAFYCDDFTANDLDAARSGYVGQPPSDERLVEQWRKALDYRADHDCNTYEAGCPCADDDGRSCWKPSIHMPRWASRIELEITGVRVERVQAISMADAIAEGARRFDDLPPSKLFPHSPHQNRWSMEEPEDCGHCLGSPQTAFGNLWIKINGQASWDANPWVWVVEFRRVEAQERAA